MKSCKIVLVGGPCGGKTESLKYFSQYLSNTGKSITTITETANALLSLGYMPNCNISPFDFQNLLFKIQFLKEYQKELSSDIMICDRGLLDGKAYIEKENFNEILKQNNVNERQILSTYDIALYFRSIAYEYPKEFIDKRIYETPEVGISRDCKSLEIWQDKILPINYDNLDGFEQKRHSLYLSLIKRLKQLNPNNFNNLSDYYDNEYIAFLINGIDTIIQTTNLSEENKQKTRRLIK